MKKLVLYCDQEIPENSKVDRRMLALVSKKRPKIGYIPSAADPDRRWFAAKAAYYDSIGATLSNYFELDVNYRPEELPDLLKCDAIHLSGGNTYHFLYWLRRRDMLARLVEFVDRGGVLIGNSAGSIMMTPEISSTDLFNDSPYTGEEMNDLSALGLVEFAFFPHLNKFPNYRSLLSEFSRKHKYPVYACADGDGILVDGNQIEFIGPAIKAQNGIISSVLTIDS
ncbi:MAG: Type 1 glutamine amidotransferase-like domain-containing protein [Anaerolineaceae bacterium]